MRKESLFAIIVGFAIGLIAAIAIVFLSKKNINLPIPSGQKKDQALKTNTAKPSASDKEKLSKINQTDELVITKPEDRSFNSAKTVMIEGKAAPESTIIILSLGEVTTTKTDKQGSFKVEVDLVEGGNDIQLVVYPKNQEPQEKIIKIYNFKES